MEKCAKSTITSERTRTENVGNAEGMKNVKASLLQRRRNKTTEDVQNTKTTRKMLMAFVKDAERENWRKEEEEAKKALQKEKERKERVKKR